MNSTAQVPAPFSPASPDSHLPQTLKAPGTVRTAEVWTTLKVNPDAMGAPSYAVIGSLKTPLFTRELIRVQWRVADPIDLFVVRPNGVQKPPVILYLYGFPADTARFWDEGWCSRTTKDGFAAVGFISALTGQRYSNRPMKEWFVSQLQEALGTTTHDVQMILSYLQHRGDLAADRVGMYGQGSGGTVALLAASVDPRISVVDVLDPWGDWPDWYKNSAEVPEDEREAYLKPDFLKSVESLDPIRYLPTLTLKSLRVQQVEADGITPADARVKIRDATQHSGHVVEYKSQQENLAAFRLTGLSGWIRDQMTSHSCLTPAAPVAATPAVGSGTELCSSGPATLP